MKSAVLAKVLLTAVLTTLCMTGQAGTVSSAVFDLTAPGSQAVIEGAIFREGPASLSPFESRVPFLRVQPTVGVTAEHGFNTDFRPLPPDAVGTLVTHSITWSTLAPRIVTTALGSYSVYSFFLDANEPATLNQNFLSIDEVRVYTAMGLAAPGTLAEITGSGMLRYSMDSSADNTVLINCNNNVGTGAIDLQIMIPKDNFAGVEPGDYVYLYVNCGGVGLVSGNDYGAQDGFEEFLAGGLLASGVEGDAARGDTPWIRFTSIPSFTGARFLYYAPGSGPVGLTLYDVHGRRAARFSQYAHGAGTHDFSLDEQLTGARFSSGVYYYLFEWNGRRRSGKIALLR